MSVQIKIVTPPQWDAQPPAAWPEPCGRAARIIFHHTAGHAPVNTIEGAKQYARGIQAMHMDRNGWNDSGHNFLVTRSGIILVGRWRTVTAIQQRRMVISAHCPTQNDQIGVEHEHLGDEPMTDKQRQAAARLQAWIADRYRLKRVLPVEPHKNYFATSCPANLADEIEPIRQLAQTILDAERDT